MNLDDTIAAVATAPGQGGIAVIRISGRQALEIAGRCFLPRRTLPGGLLGSPERQAVLGDIHRNGTVVDEVIATFFRGPRSFTAEDTVEIACHGGMLVTRLVLETCLAAGARPARPGEFSMRAYLNGRLDLSQAEAVGDLIQARTGRALDSAREQMAGALSARIELVRNELMELLTHLEAHLDFPEEDLSTDNQEAMRTRLDRAKDRVDRLLATAREGKILRQGVRTAILGLPNSGKSSLLNRLLGQDRAIVSPVAGTTRDTIEESADIRGFPVVFVDTAGLRESSDPVEQEGIRRSRAAAADAELILQVVDASVESSPEERAMLSEFPGSRRVLVANKSDLPGRRQVDGAVAISCRTGEGMDDLLSQIELAVLSGGSEEGDAGVAIGSRHQDALERARVAMELTGRGMETGLSLDLVVFELRGAVSAVGEVVGKTSTEDLLDSIFSRFCIGK
jgi:tRNA modification GTPase